MELEPEFAAKPGLFVTGASGFVGGAVLQAIHPEDYSRIVLLSRSELILPEHLAHAESVTVVTAAIHEVDRYSQYLDADCQVLHLAGLTGKAPRVEYFDVNASGTEYLVKAAARANVSRFVFVSSIAVSFKDREAYYYAESKQQAERIVMASRLEYCIVRPTIILGQSAPIWNNLSALAKGPLIVQPGAGRAKIQPIDVDDLVQLLMILLATNRYRNEILELGGPDIITMGEFLQRIHWRYRQQKGLIISLPLSLMMWLLRFVERHITEALPVSSGQFTSFCNDGTIVLNPFVAEHQTGMKGIDDMLDGLVGSDPKPNKTQAELECDVYSYYLTGQTMDHYVLAKYLKAAEPSGCLAESNITPFDKLLTRLSILHPILTRSVDGFCRFFYRPAPIRKKLIFLLAVLESHGITADKLDRVDEKSRLLIFMDLLVQSTISGLLISIATVVLLPLRRILNRGAASKVKV